MNNLRNQVTFFIISLTLLSSISSKAQSSEFELVQDKAFEKLIDEKVNINNTFSIYKNFSIQLFYGEKNESEIQFQEFKKNHPQIDATIIYAEPKYKLIVGNYRNKIDAERNLKKLKTKYPNAFIVRLTK